MSYRCVFRHCASVRRTFPTWSVTSSSRASKEGLQKSAYPAGGIELMKRYPWPGNVRELENLVRRLAALYAQDEISAGNH